MSGAVWPNAQTNLFDPRMVGSVFALSAPGHHDRMILSLLARVFLRTIGVPQVYECTAEPSDLACAPMPLSAHTVTLTSALGHRISAAPQLMLFAHLRLSVRIQSPLLAAYHSIPAVYSLRSLAIPGPKCLTLPLSFPVRR